MSNTYIPTEIESRRYIGCKAKLADWIMRTIQESTCKVCCNSFCDLFAGTGVIAKKAIELGRYGYVAVNDFLISNNVIYKAFFGFGQWNERKLKKIAEAYNLLECENLTENWFSSNYGDKYFDNKTAKLIGYIRESIESLRNDLTEKEYVILLASLIYSIDKSANTVGHFESYIKKPIERKRMEFKLINAKSYDYVKIFMEDANDLVHKFKADVFYIDPPYNSRQYSRFYHIYETLIVWDKPTLYGTALKPKPSNMSGYCRSNAPYVFEDLIRNIDAKFIAVSYNNTYTSKSHSSENKIKIEQIWEILNKRGGTQMFTHDYHAFNAGKTDIKGHQEYLFVTTVQKKYF